MNYVDLLNLFLNSGMDTQTAERLAEAIIDAGGVDKVKYLLENTQ